MSQEVVKGYKQTEIGSIPLDWQLKELRDVCIKIQDGNYGAFYPKSSEFISYGVPFLTSKVLGKAGNINFNKVDYISNEKHKVLLKAHLELNDVLFTNRGASVGAIGYVDARISNGNIGPQLTLLRVNSFVDSLYLFQIMKSSWVQKQILSQDSGSAMNFFGVGATGKFKLPIPDNINEQKIIANILTDVDALICELEKLIAKKQAIKTASMQQLLTGKTRLPQFALHADGTKKGYKQSELGEIPEDWDVKTYGEVFTFLSTSTNSRDDLSSDGDLGYIHYGDIHTKWNNRLDLDRQNLPKISRNLVSSALILDGDLIMADASEDYQGIGKSVEIFNIRNKKIVAGLHTFLLRDKNKILADGFRGYLHGISTVKAAFDRLATGLKVYGISKNNLTTIFLPVPSIEEQTAIAKILADMDSEIQELEKRLVKTRQIKQGMMQELLTGKTRLVQPEARGV